MSRLPCLFKEKREKEWRERGGQRLCTFTALHDAIECDCHLCGCSCHHACIAARSNSAKQVEMASHFLVAESILYIIVWQKRQLSVQTRHWVVSIALNGMPHCCGKAVQTALQLFFSLVGSEHRVLLLFLTALAASLSFAVFMEAAVRSLPIGSVLTPLI
ncbi:hypothetical protein TraAM80_10287 [Trypanosoma rangeli]|uniref:Uncharacterized protein n=1 Tax=Trypanosoma rangeli TaxID=5698 RepID=A0A422MQV3_TRYRA|nr:uncharacterized protein TraAM80_10287 [Trypanosoma rangeli]RNE95628.1 hypothetical protein TraAM80_10287 [Trypanosoma rangeli]|eukprot:RNE95628.1 hypothetical protein TraAM80_10287 [Trypanosoma rangeli]